MSIQIGERRIGHDQPVYVVAEIGINHNGGLETAKRLIDAAVLAGASAVKLQKRTVDVVYTPEELARPRESPFGSTNGDLKRGLEFGQREYEVIDLYCKERGIVWFASPWDEASVDFLEQFAPPCYKVASASITDHGLLRHIASKGRPVILSTGMSTLEQIEDAVIGELATVPLVLLACTSTYPCPPEELNLRFIQTLQAEFPGVPVGFSSHAVSPVPPLVAASLGACMVEAHITLDRSMYGSDQAASLEPSGFAWMVKHIRSLEHIMGDGVKRVYESEIPVRDKLRRVDSAAHVSA
jgi:N-acetylneuraminate synthase